MECGGSGLETEVVAIAPQVASSGCLDDVGSWCAHPAHCCRLLPSLFPLTLDEDWIPGLEFWSVEGELCGGSHSFVFGGV